MKEAKYERNGNRITNLSTGESVKIPHKETFPPTVNAAKKISRELQMAEDGALGRGSLRVA